MDEMTRTKKITTIGMLCAAAYIVMLIVHIPVTEFLTYDPKDTVIVMGGFILGPLPALCMALVVALVEMFTVSSTGIVGFLMNFLASCTFAAAAALVYKKMHNAAGAVMGLAVGVAASTCAMLLWNYLITPIYMGVPREAVSAMLLPVFLPFNLAKGMINSAFALIIYKPLITALRKAGLVEIVRTDGKVRLQAGVYIAAAVLLAVGVIIVLKMKNII